MSRILIWHGDDWNGYYAADTVAQREAAALEIIEERYEFGYFDKEDEQEALRVIEEKDGNAALELLDARNDYEYERIEFVYVTDATRLPPD